MSIFKPTRDAAYSSRSAPVLNVVSFKTMCALRPALAWRHLARIQDQQARAAGQWRDFNMGDTPADA